MTGKLGNSVRKKAENYCQIPFRSVRKIWSKMLRDIVTSQIVTSLCNLDTEAISPLEYDFLTQTRKQDEKRSLSQLWPMGFNFSLDMLSSQYAGGRK